MADRSFKPVSKTAAWDRFLREVKKLALELQLPQAYEIKKVVAHEKGRRSNEAWKNFERAMADLFRSVGFDKAERVSRADDLGVSDIDVVIPEIPHVKVDCKYKQDGHVVLTTFEEAEAKYVTAEGDFLVLPLKSGGKEGSISAVRSEVLADLLATKYLKKAHTGVAFGCPVCPGSLQATPLRNELSECVCGACGFAFLTQSTKVPASAFAGGVVPFTTKKSRRAS